MSLTKSVHTVLNSFFKEVPLLQEVHKGQILTPDNDMCVDKLLLFYHEGRTMCPEDVIEFHTAGLDNLYFYALHAEPFLSIVLKNAVTIKVTLYLYADVSHLFIYPENFKLFLSGKKIIKNN